MNNITPTQIRVQLRDLNSTIKQIKELASNTDSHTAKANLADMIIEARQSQLTIVSIGQKLYPQINWMNKAFEPIRLGAIKREEIKANTNDLN